MPPAKAEREFQRTLVETLELFGYVGTHIFPLMDRHGVMRTPTTSPGWPDLLYVRTPRVLAIEVKRDGVSVPERQRAWLTLFASIPCVRAWVVRPSDPSWDVIVEWIRHPVDAPRAYGFKLVENPPSILGRRRRRS